MLGGALLCLSTLHFYSVAAQGECTDLRGRVISHGLHYVPGPDTCTLCVCDNGVPRVCKAVLCSPPQDCRSFRVGNTCCEFICLDDVVKPAEGAEANVRLAAGGAAAVVLLTVALVVYRVRKQKRRRPPHADDQRSLTSIGYISGSMGYMGGTCETALGVWKPPGNYLPRGEAPPPYDEAIAQCRADAMRMGMEQYHRSYPATLESAPREDPMQCLGHGYANIQRPVPQMANPQNCYNAPLLQPAHPPESQPSSMPHHPIAPNVVSWPVQGLPKYAIRLAPDPVLVMGFPSAIRLTGSLGAISNRGLVSVLQRDPDHERPHNVPGFYTNTPAMHTSLHRTIPRISTAIEASALDSLAGFSRADRSLQGEIRRSFHKPSEARHLADTGRSMPRNLNLSGGDVRHESVSVLLDSSNARLTSGERSRAHSEEQNIGSSEHTHAHAHAHVPAHTHTHTPAHTKPDIAPPGLPLTVDKPSCVCSYEGSAPGPEEHDDYRNECENCKSASSSRWVLEEGWGETEQDGTQTLQRRAPAPAPPPPSTATLPQPVTKPARIVLSGVNPSNWENWFHARDSDTESEEE